MAPEHRLGGKRILLVEDDYPIARAMGREFATYGAEILGPAATVRDSLALIQSQSFDAAVLDINLRGDSVYPVADALAARGIPFVFATGYDRTIVPERFSGRPCCEKPVGAAELTDALFGSAVQSS